MQTVARVFQSFSDFYKEINPATLSGALDVIVVENQQGELNCSPFHVRFGKIKLLRANERNVEFKVNGKVIDFPMKVGEAGEAFFVVETSDNVPTEFMTSPVQAPVIDSEQEQVPVFHLDEESNTTTPRAFSRSSLYLNDEEQKQQSLPDSSTLTQLIHSDEYPLSDSEVTEQLL
jgi:phosphatidate phosphatase PAH1